MRKGMLFLLIFFISACSPVIETNRQFTDTESDVLTRLDVDQVYASIEELSKEPRVAGMESELKSSVFIMQQLEQYGYEVDVKDFEFDRYMFPDSVGIAVDGFNDSLSPAPFKFTVDGNISGELIDAKSGIKSDYAKIDAIGKIALVAASDFSFNEIVLEAAEAGAAAIVVYFTEDVPNEGWTLGTHDDAYIPALALSNKEGTALIDFVHKNSPVIGKFTIEGASLAKCNSQNVIVTKKPTVGMKSTDEIVIIGAHYDSVDLSPGASDNASGTAVLLEVARIMKETPTQSEVRFVFFGSEEVGLVGSEDYVSEMTQDEVERTIAMFNLDMVGSADAGHLTMFTVDGAPNNATIAGNKASEDLFGQTVAVEFTDRSDHSPFHFAGIDAVLSSYFPLEKVYHSPNDTIEKLSKKRLEYVAKIIVLSALELTAPVVNE